MAEFSNVIADNQNDIVHILENASHFNDADSGYRHVRVRDIQQNTDVSACYVKGTRMFKFGLEYRIQSKMHDYITRHHFNGNLLNLVFQLVRPRR